MRLRPCIDIHNGKVKQIVGGSLSDSDNRTVENFVSSKDAGYYASLYKEDGLSGGHIIMLNPAGTPEYEADLEQAAKALSVYPGGMQIGGGVTAETAGHFIEMGASHVIVTSYVFKDGRIDWDHLEALKKAVGSEHIVLDLSCRKKNSDYYIVTDRWQKFTDVTVTEETMNRLSASCSEFLIHAVDSEGKKAGIDQDLAEILSHFDQCPVTYAGGVGSLNDLRRLYDAGRGRLDVTIGSALDLFGGTLSYREAVSFCQSLK